MSDKLAAEWIGIAARQVLGHSRGYIAAACDRAKRECSDHRKILPTVIAECERMQAESSRLAEAGPPIPRKQLPKPEPTLAEIEENERWLNTPGEIQRKLRDAGLSCGALEIHNGRVRYVPELS